MAQPDRRSAPSWQAHNLSKPADDERENERREAGGQDHGIGNRENATKVATTNGFRPTRSAFGPPGCTPSIDVTICTPMERAEL